MHISVPISSPSLQTLHHSSTVPIFLPFFRADMRCWIIHLCTLGKGQNAILSTDLVHALWNMAAVFLTPQNVKMPYWDKKKPLPVRFNILFFRSWHKKLSAIENRCPTHISSHFKQTVKNDFFCSERISSAKKTMRVGKSKFKSEKTDFDPRPLVTGVQLMNGRSL